MYKIALKFALLTLLITGGFLLFSGGRVAAANYVSNNCPGAPDNPPNWGNHGVGEGDGAFSAVILNARGDNTTGRKPINTDYVLNSAVPGHPAYNAQIYKFSDIGSGGHTYQQRFSTGEKLYPGNYSCNGWSVLAAGTQVSGETLVGNGWVIDCKSFGANVLFWISHVDRPSGESGKWSLIYTKPDGSQRTVSDDVNGDAAAGNIANMEFNAVNGGNVRLTLVWHPDLPPPTPPQGSCTYLQASLTGNYYHQSKRTKVEIKGTNLSGGTGGGYQDYIDYIPGPNGQGGGSTYTGTTTRNYHYQPQHNSIAVTVTTQYWNGSSWQPVGSSTHIRTLGDPCFTARCSISYVTGPNDGIVEAGQPMYIHGTYLNTSPPPDNMIIWNPGLVAAGSQNGANNRGYNLFMGRAYKGYSYDFVIQMQAPSSVTSENISLTPVYFDNAAIGSPCYAAAGFPGPGSTPVYQQFQIGVSAPNPSLSPSNENPKTVSYSASANLTWVNPPAGMANHNITNAISASFYKKPADGSANTTPCSPASNTLPTETIQSSPTVLSNPSCSIAAGSYQAGDQFCTDIASQYSGGWLGPDGSVINPTGPAKLTQPACTRVINEPYFKVYNSDISAGGAFDQCLDTAHGGGGTLAGYADISDPGGVTRGSTTQLSALALLKITGVASAKTSADITGSPAKLTFANDGVQVDSTGNDSPVLGGQYGSCLTLTNETVPKSATSVGANFGIGGRNGAYESTASNVTVSGGSLEANHNVSLFVNGNVYINGDIAYGDGWQIGSAPSFVLHATGNIYIDPGVHHLAGVYIAQNKIYTCGNGFSPVQASNLYSTCRNQLIVTGSFVAKQVNLMRTFGSLRDEEPNPGTPATPSTPGASLGLQWRSWGSIPGMRCTQINEPSDPDTWYDNYLCVPSSSSLRLYWTHCATYSGCDQSPGGISKDPGQLHLNTVQASGYPYCVRWYVPSDPDTWDDNYLCANQNVGLTWNTSPLPASTHGCTNIVETSDPYGQWSSGYYLCAPLTGGSPGSPGSGPTPKGPPYTSCSSDSGAQSDSVSCAGEIFEFSPTLYLSRPAVNPPGGGSLQFQSITSLPPVL